MSARLTVVVCAPIMGRDLGPLRTVDPSLEVVDGNAAFDAYQAARRGNNASAIASARAALRQLLARAEVLCMMYPMLADVVSMTPRLRWLHHTQAGVSNLWASDVWTARDIVLTSGRGHVRTTAIAEYVMAAILSFARGLHDGYVDKQRGNLDRSHYAAIRLGGATLGVIGLGGIGREVARLARALGMRILATRRSVEAPQLDVDGVELLPAAQLAELAACSDFIAVTTALTEATRGLLDDAFFAALRRSPVIVNVSRGEVIDEAALIGALDTGRIRGAVLDVYAGELERKPPRPELIAHPGILLTPHIAGMGTDADSSYMNLFRENLQRYVRGELLINIVDRDRGY